MISYACPYCKNILDATCEYYSETVKLMVCHRCCQISNVTPAQTLELISREDFEEVSGKFQAVYRESFGKRLSRN